MQNSWATGKQSGAGEWRQSPGCRPVMVYFDFASRRLNSIASP
jgi:hypothetical protein